MVGALEHLARLHPGTTVFNPFVGAWILTFTLISLVLQIGAIALITCRIFRSISWTHRQWWTREWHAWRIVVESGAMYGVLTVLSLVFFLLRVNFGSINIGLLVQMSVSTPSRGTRGVELKTTQATAPFLMIVRAQAQRKGKEGNKQKLDRERWTQSEVDFSTPRAHAATLSSIAVCSPRKASDV